MGQVWVVYEAYEVQKKRGKIRCLSHTTTHTHTTTSTHSLTHSHKGSGGGAQRKSFREAIVFVVGSGNYVEYQNLQDYSRRAAASGGAKNVIYGTTELVSAHEFLRQLNVLGTRQFGF